MIANGTAGSIVKPDSKLAGWGAPPPDTAAVATTSSSVASGSSTTPIPIPGYARCGASESERVQTALAGVDPEAGCAVHAQPAGGAPF
jgi:hypothetical protein